MQLEEVTLVAQRLMREADIDYLDMSLWDVAKEPEDERCKGRSLMSYFTELDRGRVKLGAAGKISSAADAQRAMESGLDFVVIGRGAILHHDFPRRVQEDPDFAPVALPVSPDYLRGEGLGDAFVDYMRRWEGFVDDD